MMGTAFAKQEPWDAPHLGFTVAGFLGLEFCFLLLPFVFLYIFYRFCDESLKKYINISQFLVCLMTRAPPQKMMSHKILIAILVTWSTCHVKHVLREARGTWSTCHVKHVSREARDTWSTCHVKHVSREARDTWSTWHVKNVTPEAHDTCCTCHVKHVTRAARVRSYFICIMASYTVCSV